MSLTTKKIKTTIAGVAALLAFFAPSLASAQETVTYTVKSGDTLSEIAEKYNTTVEKLAAKNNIKDIHLIYVDQVLVIEGTASTVAPAATTEETAPVATETVEEAPAATTTYEAPAAPATPAAESNTAAASTVSGSEAEAKEWIAQKESGGSYTATNGRYIGRYQLTDSYLNGDYSAENQERVADAYVAGRYGSWTAAKNFWLNNGWY
ncbi:MULTISPECIES: LysM peptidoglycan-binding domain-containing protein [Streptococcus]|uniref:Peptidoglycan-binding protein LysM n=2 Tax=Streptococcus oralis TaxID=1303 RepID=A0A1X1HYF3_STROR|nr:MULTISPECIES: LysM peptidoglycan-binding domain-containing protein [Streptococcus]MCP9082879.1 LysM peptidoglycan-binding domain-containing protein [Streptococcus sp. CF10-1]MCP9126159.1 LysM peptidoglycan-binding domain-containing protein [Streptococcus oralis]MCY7081408.1 LysM peptidoglycan-binding domain-containing protein [Streptococcus oralis]OFP33970.1 peptidoglycan-binding protein LysM [Streptococcus sp. HMSC072D07]ORO47027.1 peptidoglycan-binding protein LysM [Streptococcus oralis s